MKPEPDVLSRADYPQTLDDVAAPVLQAIERDRRRAPGRLRPLLGAILETIFDPDLDLDQVIRDAGLDETQARRLLAEFGDELGRSPWSYLRDHRLDVAARLLLETPIALLEIGKMVGYTSPSSFRQLMRDFLGMSASQYRRSAPRVLERAAPAPADSNTPEYWERMLAGELCDDEARELDAYLERLAPVRAPEPPADGEAERFSRLRQKLADGFVDTLETLDLADRRRFARDAAWFPDDTYFQRHSRRSREVAEGDPEAGTLWALLAIDSVAANQTFELETDPALSLLGWARLALTRWRAGDLAGAEKDVQQAEREAARVLGNPCPGAWKAEACRVVAAFDWHQGRRLKALTIAEVMVALHRAIGPEALRQALLLRAELRTAYADSDAGEDATEQDDVETGTRVILQGALADVEEALDLPGAGEDDRAGVVGLRSRILVLLGERAEMAVALAQARRRETPASELEAAILLWLEGHAETAPEALWRQARERFSALGDELWVTRIDVDLARRHLATGRAERAAARAAKVAARLGAMVTAPEDSAALKALGRAASGAGELARADLDRVERILKRLEWQRRAADGALRLALAPP